MKKFFSAIYLLIFILACSDEPALDSGQVIFSICPVDTAAILEASPLGNLNPPGHTFPSDHIGFYLKGSDSVPVHAMTAGTIRTIYYNEWSDDYRIEFIHTESIISYLDHISNLPLGVILGATLNTGDLVGYARLRTGAFDIGVVNYNKVTSFNTPERYHEFYLHYDDPYNYFTDSIRYMLEAKNPRIGEPKGGRVCFDLYGTLAGNWFLEGTPVNIESSGYQYGAYQLAFVYDMYNSSIIRISCGGTLEGSPFAFTVTGNSPAPESVTPSSGKVKYVFNAPLFECTMLVQMLDEERIRVQTFKDIDPSEVDDFNFLVKIYTR